MDTNKFTFVFLLLTLAGCSSIPKDYGRGEVDSLLADRNISIASTKDSSSEEYVDTLVAKPLNVDSATQLALIKNAGLKKTYAQLGISAADVYEAGRIRNPVFSYSELDSNQSGERDLITLGFITSLADLIMLPSRKKIADQNFEASKQAVGAEVLETVQEVQTAFFEYQVAEQIALVREQISKTAQLSSDLAHRYHDAGNINDRELLEENTFAIEAKFESFESNAEAIEARTELANLLGLKIEEDWSVVSQVPLPPDESHDVEQLVSTANQSRLDLAAANTEAENLARSLGVTNWSRFIGDLDIGIERERETDGAKLTGPVFEWEVPIFSQHSDAKLRAASELQIAMAEVAQLNNEIHNEVHLNYIKADGARLRVHEYENNLLPAKSAIVDRAQEEENFMLIGTFELLHTKIEEYDSYVGYLESIRDYWIAHTHLMHAVGDSLAHTFTADSKVIDIKDLLISESSAHSHSEHAHH